MDLDNRPPPCDQRAHERADVRQAIKVVEDLRKAGGRFLGSADVARWKSDGVASTWFCDALWVERN